MLHIDIERYRGMHVRNVMLYRRIKVWKNGRMAGYIAELQDGSVYDGRMEWPFSASVSKAASSVGGNWTWFLI